MFMFGIKCVRCDQELIAPGRTEFLGDKIIRHFWQPEMQGMVRIVSSVSRRRKIGERSDAEGGYISAAERDLGHLALD
jgi:hypothetical protein